jgi:hydroxyacylglutathione hydrolase
VIIETFPVGTFETKSTIIFSKSSKDAIIIDPGAHPEPAEQKIENLNLNVLSIIHTHAHLDHIGSSKYLKEKYKVPLSLHKKDLTLYKGLPAQALMMGMKPMLSAKIDHNFEDGDILSFNDGEFKNFFKVIFTPGHTQGSVCFYNNTLFTPPLLISGDTLFQGSIGRTDLPGGNSELILKSIREKLFVLPDETNVITGHGPNTTISFEKMNNPFFQ